MHWLAHEFLLLNAGLALAFVVVRNGLLLVQALLLNDKCLFLERVLSLANNMLSV